MGRGGGEFHGIVRCRQAIRLELRPLELGTCAGLLLVCVNIKSMTGVSSWASDALDMFKVCIHSSTEKPSCSINCSSSSC